MRVLVLVAAMLALAAWLVLRFGGSHGAAASPNALATSGEAAPGEGARSSDELPPASLVVPPPTDERSEPAPARHALAPARAEPVVGRVEVAGGIPLGDAPAVVATVHRAGSSRPSPPCKAPIASNGSFTLELPADTRWASLELESLVLALPEEIDVRPGMRDVLLRPDLLAGVRGSVRLPALPAPASFEARRIQVSCQGASGDVDASGRFVLAAVPIGEELRISVESTAGEPWLHGEVDVGPLAAGEIRDVELDLAASTKPTPFVFPSEDAEDAVELRGTVVDGEGVPVEGAAVAARRLDLASFHRQTKLRRTDASGRFEFPALQPDTWQIEVRTPGRDRASLTVNLPADGREDLHVVLGAVARVRGRVRKPDGSPCAGALVTEIGGELYFASSWPGDRAEFEKELAGDQDPEAEETRSLMALLLPEHVTTDAAGDFTLALHSGPIRLAAMAPGFAPSRPLELALASGVIRDEVEFVLREGCTLRGVVVDEAGSPMRNTSVRYESADGSLVDLTTDEAGRLASDELPEGRGRLSAPSVMWLYRGYVQVELARGKSVEVQLDAERVP